MIVFACLISSLFWAKTKSAKTVAAKSVGHLENEPI